MKRSVLAAFLVAACGHEETRPVVRDVPTPQQPVKDAELARRTEAATIWAEVSAQIDGKKPRDADALVGAADRLLALGRAMNGVPLARRSFADWTPPAQLERECWTHAAACFEAALAVKPDARTAIRLGRTYGFLGRWSDAARVDAAAFAREPILAPDRRRIDRKLVTDRSDLVVGYLEWGVAERMAFRVDRDKERLLRCRDVILAPLANSLQPEADADVFWGARYHFARTLMDRGEYRDAQLSIEDIARQVSPAFDNDDFGYATRFRQAEAEMPQ